MLTKTIYLNRHKAKKYDYKEFMAKYDADVNKYNLLAGAPILVNVEGTYINANQLLELCKPSIKMTVSNYIESLKCPTSEYHEFLEFKWAD